MTETQQSIAAWMNATFPGADPESPRKALRAMEEMVELCFAAGASCNDVVQAVAEVLFKERGAEYRTDLTFEEVKSLHAPEPGKVAGEAADVLIILYGLASLRRFDLHKAVDEKMAVNRARKWKARGDGTGYHVKDAAP